MLRERFRQSAKQKNEEATGDGESSRDIYRARERLVIKPPLFGPSWSIFNRAIS